MHLTFSPLHLVHIFPKINLMFSSININRRKKKIEKSKIERKQFDNNLISKTITIFYFDFHTKIIYLFFLKKIFNFSSFIWFTF